VSAISYSVLATPLDRYRAIQYHTPGGPEGVETLCLALTDSSNNVRLAAARKLVLGGDGRAIQPLVTALQATYVTRWPQAQMGLSALFLMVVVAIALLTGLLTVQADGWQLGIFYSLSVLLTASRPYFDAVRERSELRAAIAHALTQITEHEPCAEASRAVRALRAFSRDIVEQDRASRLVCADAADRIEAEPTRKAISGCWTRRRSGSRPTPSTGSSWRSGLRNGTGPCGPSAVCR
jgi:hypothetical protein